MQELLLWIALLVATFLMGLFLRWAWRDAKRRGAPPFWVCCLVLMFFPVGLIVWMVFRPLAPAGITERKV
jgi:hypothetical protein